MERGTKEIPAAIINKLVTEFNVSPSWFYSSIGNIFSQPNEVISQTIKKGTLKTKRMESELSKEDPENFQLYNALVELPDLAKMFQHVVNIIDLENVAVFSSVGQVWIPDVAGVSKNNQPGKLDFEIYKDNIGAFLHHLSDYRTDIVDFNRQLKSFLNKIRPLDKDDVVWIPDQE